jgi:hypothetical protein
MHNILYFINIRFEKKFKKQIHNPAQEFCGAMGEPIESARRMSKGRN